MENSTRRTIEPRVSLGNRGYLLSCHFGDVTYSLTASHDAGNSLFVHELTRDDLDALITACTDALAGDSE